MKITVDGTIARLEVLPDSVVVGMETDPWALQQIHIGREHAASLCAYVGKSCTISIEAGEPADGLRPITIGESGGDIHINSSHQSPSLTPLVNPLDEGWQVLTAAMEKRGFVRMPFDGTRVVKFVERDAPDATSMPRWVTVNDEYAARFSGALSTDVDSLLSAMGLQ